MIDFCRFQSEFFRTSVARSEKFNHDFNHENRHSGTGYIEKAVFVPCRFQSRFQSRFSAQWNTPLSCYSSLFEVLCWVGLGYVCLWVCLSARISPEPSQARSLPIFVHVAYVRGSVFLRNVYDSVGRIACRREGVFFPTENALSAEKRGLQCTPRAKYAIYDCLVVCMYPSGRGPAYTLDPYTEAATFL